MASQTNQTVHNGNTAVIKFHGNIIGRAQGVDGRRSFGTQGVYEIGSIMPKEHVQNQYQGTLTVDRYLVRLSDLADLGLAKLGADILDMDEIDIEVIDKITKKTIRVYRGCTTSDYSENFRVGTISGENATFQYLSCDKGE